MYQLDELLKTQKELLQVTKESLQVQKELLQIQKEIKEFFHIEFTTNGFVPIAKSILELSKT